MIRIDRGKAPDVLEKIRSRELPRVRELIDQGKKPDFGRAYGHQAVRAALLAAQGGLCCYCETPLREKWNPVEHFRPKAGALRGPGRPAHGYWWLAWTWENLWIACHACNGYKGDHFPLAPGSPILGRGRKPPGEERPLLLDAGSDLPSREIRFEHRNGHWRPFPKRISSIRGKTTIERLALDSEKLQEWYDDHVTHRVLRRVDQVKAGIAANDAAAVKAAWHDLRRSLFGPRAPYKALSHAVVTAALRAADRKRWGLSLPKL